TVSSTAAATSPAEHTGNTQEARSTEPTTSPTAQDRPATAHIPARPSSDAAMQERAASAVDVDGTNATQKDPVSLPPVTNAHDSSQPGVIVHAEEPAARVASTITDTIVPSTDGEPMAVADPAQADTAQASHLPATIATDTSNTDLAENRGTVQYRVTADTATAPPAPLSPALSPRRLELSAWGGPFMTRTHYSGDRTTDWASTVSGGRAFAFGAELMRQGEHFGLGTGLHYMTYAERIEAQGLQDETRTTVTSYHLSGIDTTVLIVNGTVWINGQQYHATQMLDTTIYVLVGTDSEVVSTNVRRNALTRSNRTSYLEIPLLFDAHLRRGVWSFAVRGGPTLGLLQGRRGALPTTSGYTDLGDEAFSELVLGYTIQGHVRYHLGELWSVGVGPALRGQLTNGFQGEGLHRRASAAGAVISVGYRLP
ncbi:MAG: hypothetical protein KF797_08755, partial [Flavobacteriales bacterium]|nr:hypothetical protein [Flavobacteriales bacterium]